MTVDVSEMTEAQQQVLENEGIEVVGAAGGDGNETPPDYKKSDGGVESA